MLIDVYGLIPSWSRTAAYQPRTPQSPRIRTFRGRLLFVLSLLSVFPVMVNSIEPVPSSFWSLSVDPSYMPPSTSRSEAAELEGSGGGSGADGPLEETSSSPTPPTTTHASPLAWFAGRRGHHPHRKHNISSTDNQNPKRRESIGQAARHKDDDEEEDEEQQQQQQRHEEDEEVMGDQLLTEPPPPAAVVRWYRLYNRCSGGYLQMYMNDVNARGKFASPLAQLRVETDSYGSRIRIQSEKFGKYLCFNRRQRITSKYNGRSERCVFIEKISDNHYTELESAWRPGLYLGFNRGDGKFLDPSRYYTDRRTCFQFVKNANTSSSLDAFNVGVAAPPPSMVRNEGPADFARLSPERQRWFRARMHQEAGTVGDEADDWRHADHLRYRQHHRLRHERAKSLHRHRENPSANE